MARKKKSTIVEVVEGKGQRIPIYKSPVAGYESYLLAYYQAGQRIRERAKSFEAAKKRASELIDSLSDGSAHVEKLTARDHAVVSEALQILDKTGEEIGLLDAVRQFADATEKLDGQGTIADAVRVFLEQREMAKLTPVKLPDLVEVFLASIREQKLSRRYVLDMQARLHKAAESFTGQIVKIRTADVDAWLKGMKQTSGRTRNNYRNAIITLFRFAKDKGYLLRDQQTEAEYSSRYNGQGGAIGIYTPEQVELLLNRIAPRLLPVVAIGAFAGLRSAEISRLEWSEVLFDQDVIEIKARKAKTATRRLAPILPVLAAWLKPFAKKSGRVLQGVNDEFALATQFKKAVDAITGPDGKPLLKIIHNGFRHSFISCRMAVLKNAAEVSLEAGNSPRMIFEHYRELVTERTGKEWFSKRPSKGRLKEISAAIA